MSDTLRCWNGQQFLTGTCDELLESRLVSLQGPILKDNSLNLIAQLLYLDNQGPRLPIYLNVSSPGGCVGSSFAVVDAIRELNAPVHTICLRLVAGTAVMIVSAGREGSRFAHMDSILSFLPSSDDESNPVGAQELGRINRLMADELEKTTNFSCSLFLKFQEEHCRFSPVEAIELGLIDHIIVDV
jgi:ATP-dependent Clp protease protease subunit